MINPFVTLIFVAVILVDGLIENVTVPQLITHIGIRCQVWRTMASGRFFPD